MAVSVIVKRLSTPETVRIRRLLCGMRACCMNIRWPQQTSSAIAASGKTNSGGRIESEANTGTTMRSYTQTASDARLVCGNGMGCVDRGR